MYMCNTDGLIIAFIPKVFNILILFIEINSHYFDFIKDSFRLFQSFLLSSELDTL